MAKKQVLDSWKGIADYLKRSEKTCRRLEKELGLPIHRLEDSPKARVFAYKDEIDLWIEKTQHSEKKIFLRKSRLKKLFIPALVVVAIVIVVVIILQLLPKKEAVPLPSGKHSLAVLPFEDLSPEQDQAYFCDGIAAELINRLTNIENLKVPARASSFSFKVGLLLFHLKVRSWVFKSLAKNSM